MNPLDDPDVKLAKQDLRDARRMEREAGLHDMTPSAYARKHRLNYRPAPHASDAWPLLPIVVTALWSVAGFAFALRWVSERLPTTAPPWLGAAIAALCWPVIVLLVAFALHKLRRNRPRVYAVLILAGTAAIVWGIAGDMPASLSMAQVLAMLGATFSAVDGFKSWESSRSQFEGGK